MLTGSKDRLAHWRRSVEKEGTRKRGGRSGLHTESMEASTTGPPMKPSPGWLLLRAARSPGHPPWRPLGLSLSHDGSAPKDGRVDQRACRPATRAMCHTKRLIAIVGTLCPQYVQSGCANSSHGGHKTGSAEIVWNACCICLAEACGRVCVCVPCVSCIWPPSHEAFP